MVSGLCYLLLSIPSALYAYFLRKQGAVFVLNEQYLEYQSKAGGDYQRHSLDEIAEIRYLVSPVYRGYQSKRLRIVGNKGTTSNRQFEISLMVQILMIYTIL